MTHDPIDTPDGPREVRSDSGPRTGPIVWGALILAFCAYVVQRTVSPTSIDTTGWVAITVIGLGALFLIVGIVVMVRNRTQQRAGSSR